MSDTEVIVVDEFRSPKLMLHARTVLDDRAKLAASLVERWGMVAGTPDGEDSAGRSKLRLSSVAEVTARAFDAAEAVWAEAEKRGMLVDMPTWDEIAARADELRKRN